MIRWLSGRKNIAQGVLKKIRPPTQEQIVSAPKANGNIGAAHALARLEETENQLHAEVMVAKDSGDPVAYREKLRAWLQCVETLRKIDLSVSADRRAGQDLLPIAEFEKFSRRLIASMAVVIQGRAENLAVEVAGSSERVAYSHIRQSIDASLLAAALAFSKAGPKDGRPDPRIVAHVERCVVEHYGWKFDESFRVDVEAGIVGLIKWAFEQP